MSAAVALLLSAGAHCWRIGSHPAGLFHDESSIMYNAYSVACTGADEYGTRLPVFFRGFDNYHDPVMVYATAPLSAIFGLKPWTGRLISGLFHLAAGVAFFFLAVVFVPDRWIALGGAFLFSLLPWVFPVSRLVMAGYTPMLFGMVLGMALLILAYERRSPRFAAGAGVAWAFAMYSHNIGRPMSALYLICFVAASIDVIFRHRRVSAAFVIAYLVCMLPMIVGVFRHPEALVSRFSTLSIWHDSPGGWVILQRMASRYADYFSPGFLFVTGDSNLRHHTGAAGELYAFMIPLIVLGVFELLRKGRDSRMCRFLLLAWVTYPAAAVLTMDRLHSTRAINGSIIWTLVCVLGAGCMWRQRRLHAPLAAIALVGGVEMTRYMHDYFTDYGRRSRPYFNAELTEAIACAFAELRTGETLSISGSVVPFEVDTDFKPHLYAHLLFFSGLEPGLYQRTGIPPETIRLYSADGTPPGLLLRNSAVLLHHGGRLVVAPNPEPLPSEANKLTDCSGAGNDSMFELYRIPSLLSDAPSADSDL